MPITIRTFDHATIVNVVDGDTCDIAIDLGFNITVKLRFRLSYINTPERGQPGWQEATDFLSGYMNTSVVVLSSKLDKYGRYLAEILYDGVSINQLMLEKGLAVRYA